VQLLTSSETDCQQLLINLDTMKCIYIFFGYTVSVHGGIFCCISLIHNETWFSVYLLSVLY